MSGPFNKPQEETKQGIFGSKSNKTSGLFGSTASAGSPLNFVGNSISPAGGKGLFKSQGESPAKEFGKNSHASMFGNNSKAPSTILGGSQGFKASSRGDEDMDVDNDIKKSSIKSLMKSSSAGYRLSEAVEKSLIESLSASRSEQITALSNLGNRLQNEINVKKISFKQDKNSEAQFEMIKKPNQQKEFNKITLSFLNDFRSLINNEIAKISKDRSSSAGDKDVCFLQEISLVALIMYSFHFVDRYYVPLTLRNIIATITRDEHEDMDDGKQSLGDKLFRLLRNCQFEKADELLNSVDETSEVIENISNLIRSVAKYFKAGYDVAYQEYEISQLFADITDRAAALKRGL